MRPTREPAGDSQQTTLASKTPASEAPTGTATASTATASTGTASTATAGTGTASTAATDTPATSSEGAAESGQPARTGRPRLVVAALSIGTFTFVTTELLPIGLLPLIGADLDRSLSATGQLVTAYALVVVLVSLPLTLLTGQVPKRMLLGTLLAVFAVAALASALAPSFGFLLAARVVTAISQALFWSVVTSTAVGRFPPAQRARVIGTLFIGSSLAPVVGLPIGTWIGQHAGWRAAFAALAGLAITTCTVVVIALPTIRPEDEPARYGDAPNTRRYILLLLTTALVITGMFSAYTYVAAHLTDVAGLPASALSGVLLLSGLAGVLGVIANGTVLHRRPRADLLIPLATMTAALWLLHLAGRHTPAAVVAFLLVSFAVSGFASGLGGRVLLVAPGSTDLASAGSSTAFNVGIGAGSWIGGLIVAGSGGVHATALAAALFAGAAFAVMLCEPWIAPETATMREPGTRT